MSLTNRLRDMDDRLGDMDTNIYKLSNDVKDLTYVVSGMYEQYDRFYGEFGQMRMEQERFWVQQGVNFMSSPQVFSTTPTASPNQFGYFDASDAGTSTSQNPRNDMDEE
ncbi:hypothetical protein Tco_0718920 [Tanacetum coccineum]